MSWSLTQWLSSWFTWLDFILYYWMYYCFAEFLLSNLAFWLNFWYFRYNPLREVRGTAGLLRLGQHKPRSRPASKVSISLFHSSPSLKRNLLNALTRGISDFGDSPLNHSYLITLKTCPFHDSKVIYPCPLTSTLTRLNHHFHDSASLLIYRLTYNYSVTSVYLVNSPVFCF